jgi:hypothetical protein
MNTMERPRVVRESLQETMVTGLHSAESTLFNHCVIIQERLTRLGVVINVLEESLTSPDAIEELKDKSVNVRFDYYNAFSKIMMNLIGYMERIHDMAADQVKFNAIKDKLDSLREVTAQDTKGVGIDRREDVNELLELIKDEMIVRGRGK